MMPEPSFSERISDALQRLAGYLNFSSGPCDAATLTAWNDVYEAATEGDPLTGEAAWLVMERWIDETLDRLQAEGTAFRDVDQARRAAALLFIEFLPAYMDYHRDLLFHQVPELIYNGLFMARAAEAILTYLSAGHDSDAGDSVFVDGVICQLNDFVGYRPVAVLEGRQCQAYPHEYVRPVPLYVKSVGVSVGPYQELISLAIDALRETNSDVLRAASFDLDRLEELSLDPRAYDFDHPVNRRPNYHFGGWDDHAISIDGYYNRFVVRQVTLDALLSRLQDHTRLDRHEMVVEAASVLAGTILMASGVSGWGPGAYTSDVTLGGLMKPIAAYRDAFYQDRIRRLSGEHASRLAEEERARRQPFGAARQHLNAALARRRAIQLQHVQLARLYARMGYPESATKQADTVKATSARMICRIDCAMTSGLRSLRSGKLDEAVGVSRQAFDLIKRGIHCGALIDPWDILAFGGNYSLYPGPESGIHDARLDDMLYLMEQLFGYTARVWSEAAAQDDAAAYDAMDTCYGEIAEWWRQFAAHTVSSIEATDPLESYDSAKLVAQALRFWHRGGAAAGDVAFWAPHADLFDSPRAYALVISALLERRDFVPVMALIVHWLGNADRVGLRSGGSSLPRLAERWLLRLRDSHELDIDGDGPDVPASVWPLSRKFFDYLEANAEEFWSAPEFCLGDGAVKKRDWDVELTAADSDEDYSSDDGVFDAAYEGMTYQDTTDDGNEGAIFEFGDEGSLDELEAEAKRLAEHLTFLQSLARMWAVAADVAISQREVNGNLQDQIDTLQSWAKRAKENRIGLLELLDAVRSYRVVPAGCDKDSMRSYDRQRVLRDSVMENVIGTAVEMSDSRRLICGTLSVLSGDDSIAIDEEMAEDDTGAIALYAALIAGDAKRTSELFPLFLNALHNKNLLYIPLSRGGDPVKIYVARLRQRVLRHMMHWMPRVGNVSEACRLIETARLMEQQNPIGIGAVTEFDGLFKAGFSTLVESIIESTIQGVPEDLVNTEDVAEDLINVLEMLTETLLGSWLAHSQTLRLSPLEMVIDPRKWAQLVQFIKDYGDPVFTQMFLQLGNVRAILHQGAGAWLKRAVAEGDDRLCDTKLADDLESGVLSFEEADRWITLVYESLIDHHAEYQDYNSTTTQSDRGDLIYTFLDFLRLRVRYERISWNLKPVMWAHEVLVRRGLDEAAMIWRRSLSERIGSEAEIYVQKLVELQKKYAMRMPTIADRISERYIQPMTIDRMRALIGPAMKDAEADHTSHAFAILEEEAELLTRNPTGVGLDVPVWLEALESEVEKLAKRQASSEIDPQSLITVAFAPLDAEVLAEQLVKARTQGRHLPFSGSSDE